MCTVIPWQSDISSKNMGILVGVGVGKTLVSTTNFTEILPLDFQV